MSRSREKSLAVLGAKIKSWEKVEDPTLAEARESSQVFIKTYLLDDGGGEDPLRGYINADLVPVITYERDGFKATVRPVGPVGGHVFFPGERKLSQFLPKEPGEYCLDEEGVHPAGHYPNRGGSVRRFFCRLGLHWKMRLEGFNLKVKQCPYCLKVKVSWAPLAGTYAPSEFWGGERMYERFVREYDLKFPLPRGPWRTIPLDIERSPDGRSISFEL